MPHLSCCPQTILVVDDEAYIRDALRRQLQQEGYVMKAAESGAKALAFAAYSVIDLVILDLKMPGLDGLETCRRLKAMPGMGDIPVLILTGDQGQADYKAAIEAGADDFLMKPVLFQELLLRLQSLLRLKRCLIDLRESVATIQAQQDVILKEKAMRERLQAFLLHDLKNPISNLLLQAEMQLANLEDPMATEPWGHVLNNAERLMMLVTGWMDCIHSEDVGLCPRKTRIDTKIFLNQLLARHALWFQVKRLKGRVEVDPELAEIIIDPVMMERVLGNLLENCIRYAPEETEILVTARLGEDSYVRLEIADRGPGIPLQLRESIFDMYIQLEASTSARTDRGSRGLGLAFCRMATEAHGGHIWVESHPEGGTQFVIQFPRN